LAVPGQRFDFAALLQSSKRGYFISWRLRFSPEVSALKLSYNTSTSHIPLHMYGLIDVQYAMAE
jgi:hypothetical protein